MVISKNEDLAILGIKDGHDGALALITGNQLNFCIEAEKNNGLRYSSITPDVLLNVMSMINKPLDVIAQSGWSKVQGSDCDAIGAGYSGLGGIIYQQRIMMGQEVTYFSSSHERSHLLCAYGLSPFPQGRPCYALIWEGHFGEFYRIDKDINITKLGKVIDNPGDRFAFLYGLADPSFNLDRGQIRLSDAGKLMALAAYGEGNETDKEGRRIIDLLLDSNLEFRDFRKEHFRDSHYYNIGFEDPRLAALAFHFSNALFNKFYQYAKTNIVFDDAPLLIAGGCGLNCDWNTKWIETGLFSDVFIPPCANDSGSAIGTAIDALLHTKGIAKILWSPYAGEFPCDDMENLSGFTQEEYNPRRAAQLLDKGYILGWAQGRYEMGPRALGNRSILAAPYPRENLKRLNRIKVREGFRPIAPICLEENMGEYFKPDHPSPYMLEFRRVISNSIPAVTHVDHSARPQSVNKFQNFPIHQLLTEYKNLSGIGVLCNTSLNFNSRGFINRLSDLSRFAIEHGLDGFIFNNKLFLKVGSK
jgi:predicted NodU family carbamoyl transferase